MRQNLLRIICVAVAASATAGCSGTRDAGAEAPVDLKPGRYQVSYEGAAYGFKMPGQKDGPGADDRSICVGSGNAKHWPKMLVRSGLGMDEGCSFDKVDRTGNALSGELVCEGDQGKMPGGEVKLVYSGAMSETDTVLDAKLAFDFSGVSDDIDPRAAADIERIKQSTEMLEAVSVVITATRTGDCTA